jgi:GMP synthase (glutamine-hydrolysing)
MKTHPRALAVQHVAVEPPNAIAAAMEAEGVLLDVVRVDRGESVPKNADGLAALVVMGGPMGVYEAHRFPHLVDEMRLVDSALRMDVPVLGVCLGSQLLAQVLGARVAPAGFQEIGWYPVTLEREARTDPVLGACATSFTALHWHGDAFELPRGAVHLARSERTPVQAFRVGRSLGLLFHAEVDGAQVAEMSQAFGDELARAGVSAAELAEGSRRHGGALREMGLAVFRRFARLASEA